MKRVTFCQVLLHCALIVCTFFGNFKSFWKYKSMIDTEFLIYNNNAYWWFFNLLQFVKIFALWLLGGDGGITPWTIFMCHPFFVLLVRLNWQVYCWDSFQTLSFLPGSKQSFCNTCPLSVREERSAELSTFPVLLGVSQS